jgi:hypothetical protein
LADPSSARGRWTFRPVTPESRSITELIRTGTLDAELAATLWLLVEGRVPMIVAAEGRGAGKTTLLTALLDFLPAGQNVVELRGIDETFDWMPQASELGWPGVPSKPTSAPPVRPEDTVLVAAELSDHTPAYTWGEAARVAVRAAAIGYGLAATIHGDSLDDVFAELGSNPVRLTDDELSRLGAVVILRRVGGRRRVVAAHYVRPIVRDNHGHLQRLGPAVLATWSPAADAFEHFAWGVIPELAMRVGRRPGDFELETTSRRAFLEGLVAEGVVAVAPVRARLARYVGPTGRTGTGDRAGDAAGSTASAITLPGVS